MSEQIIPGKTDVFYANANGVKIAYDQVGQGTDAVFVHGFTFNRQMWNEQVPYLQQRLRMTRLELRGHGDSDAPAEGYSPLDYDRDILAVFEAAGIDRAPLVGMSIGGRQGLRFALSHPERVSKLVLVAPVVEGIAPDKETMNCFRSMAKGLAGGRWEQVVDEHWLQAGYWDVAREHPELLAKVREMVLTYSGGAFKTREQTPREVWQKPEDYAEIQCPVLIIAGELDTGEVKRGIEAVAVAIPNCTVKTLAGRGHTVNMEAPEETARLIEEFIVG